MRKNFHPRSTAALLGPVAALAAAVAVAHAGAQPAAGAGARPAAAATGGAVAAAIDWAAVEAETLRHFESLVRADTSDPPGNEKPAADYLESVLEAEGIAVKTFAKEAHRPNVVARLPGSGRKRPLLLMAHTDVVNVDPAKWSHPPFGAVRDGGYIYGRGALDDKDNVTAALMTMLVLKRANVPLDRDVIFLAEAGEEGATAIGIEHMVGEHFDEIDAEYCLAEGSGPVRENGRVRYAPLETGEKVPHGIDLVATGVSGHGSVPLQANAIARLAKALAAVTDWQPPAALNATTRAYFTRLAGLAAAESATRYRDLLSDDPRRFAEADAWLRANEPRHAAMLRTSLSPTIVKGGYRNNVIPSEATATLDVRMRPGEDYDAFLARVNEVIGDPSVVARFNGWPPTLSGEPRRGGVSRIDNEGFAAIEHALGEHYGAPVVPTLLNAATDMAFLRERGMQCYGMGPAVDAEDAPKGYGWHGDQERILEAELHRFVRFKIDVVTALARAGAAE